MNSGDLPKKLVGSLNDALTAKQDISKTFQSYGSITSQDVDQQQLRFAVKVTSILIKCNGKHGEIYLDILINIFGTKLKPQANVKLWTMYVDHVRYIQYTIKNKADHSTILQLTKALATYKNKIQTENIGKMLLDIYRCQWILTVSRLQDNESTTLREVRFLMKVNINLYKEMLEKNKNFQYQYGDILAYSMQYLIQMNMANNCLLYMKLPEEELKDMFEALFQLYSKQVYTLPDLTNAIHSYIEQYLICIDWLLQFDLKTDLKFKTSLMLLLMKIGQNHTLLQSHKTIHEFNLYFCDYFTMLRAKNFENNFCEKFYIKCKNMKMFLCHHLQSGLNENWFCYIIIVLQKVCTNLVNHEIFENFWKHMCEPLCYKILLELLYEAAKACVCINSENKLFKLNCCQNISGHAYITFAQCALAIYEFYAHSISDEKELLNSSQEQGEKHLKNSVHTTLINILSYACEEINKMDCVTSVSLLTVFIIRFKNITLKVQTQRQAITCMDMCKMFKKIKTKIPPQEWPVILRRLYKTVIQHIKDDKKLGRELHTLYIASLLDFAKESKSTQLREQINLYHATNVNEKCLYEIYEQSRHPLKPVLTKGRQTLFFWFESKHILKYHKNNSELIASLLHCSPSDYDFVIVFKNLDDLPQMQTKVMSRVHTLHQTLRGKHTLNRLEYLVYGHVASILLQQQCDVKMAKMSKTEIELKELAEDHLQKLLTYKEFAQINFKEELSLVALGMEAYKAFNNFFKNFDDEFISSDEALIDWKLILDDLMALAQRYQISGYLEHSSQVWLLHYEIATLIQDNYAALRSFMFFLEYAECLQQSQPSQPLFGIRTLEDEIKHQHAFLITALNQLDSLTKRHQNYVLLCLLQLAHYYARHSHYPYAQILLQLVETTHSNLNDRQGKYDIITTTVDAIKIHLLWKHYEGAATYTNQTQQRSYAANQLMNCGLLRQMEQIMEKISTFTSFSTGDNTLYKIVLIQLTEMFAECLANRLCDNIMNSFFVAICKIVIQSSLALRFVRLMCCWMWVNLQQENVDKARIKLQLIECVMGMKNINEYTVEKCTNALAVQEKCQPTAMSPTYTSIMESVRKVAQVQLSPINSDKLRLSPSFRKLELKRFLQCPALIEMQEDKELLDWTSFMVGCFIARLYFLVEDYNQLDDFYEQACNWLHNRQNLFNKKHFKNIHLLAIQHYVNYLRSQGKYGRALSCLKENMVDGNAMRSDIDVVYRINFELQLQTIHKEMADIDACKKSMKVCLARKVLQFNGVEYEEEAKFCRDQVRKIMSEEALQLCLTPKIKEITSNNNNNNNKGSIMKNAKSQPKSNTVRKPKIDYLNTAFVFADCMDDGEATEIKNLVTPKVPRKRDICKMPNTTSKLQIATTSKLLVDLPSTPIIKTTTTTTTTTKLTETKEKPKSSPQSEEITEKIENLALNTNDRIATIKRLKERNQKPALIKQSSAPAPIIIIEDSPSTTQTENNTCTVKTRSKKNKKSSIQTVANSEAEQPLNTPRTTRQRGKAEDQKNLITQRSTRRRPNI